MNQKMICYLQNMREFGRKETEFEYCAFKYLFSYIVDTITVQFVI